LLSFLTEAETLAAAEEQPGRRNWSKCRVVTDVTCTKAHLFPDDCPTQAAVRELCKQEPWAVHPAIASGIDFLLQQQKKGFHVQAQLDAQLTISLLPTAMQPLFLTQIQLRPEHLLHADQVQDIGHIVRDIMMLKQRNDVLFKLYQYTMPFIKHNRLNFPPMQVTSKAVLMHMVQVMALTCLGLYSPKHKTPTWRIRCQLFVFFTNLLTRGTMRDIYTFCQYHTYMLRLALMEYFVYFTSKHMTAEMPLLLKCTGTFYDHQRTQGLVQYITDHFRTSALQTEELDWTLVESKAQLSVERCNRTCKSQQLLGREKFAVLADTMTPSIFRLALATPRLDARRLPRAVCESDLLFAAACWGVHNSVCKYALPILLQHKQFQHVEQMSLLSNNSTVVARSLLYVCLRCNQKHPYSKENMRIQYPEQPICRHCNSSNYVCVADTLGHLVSVFGNYYYFCVDCSRVHSWRGCGSELGRCPWSREHASISRRHCAVCLRTLLLSAFSVFDKRLGVVQSLYLCSKHSPPAALLHSVHDLGALRCLVSHLST